MAFLLFSLDVEAQTNRYWSNSFNTDASLLSGAVVGGGSGITALYYNPAQIADITYKKFAITANIFSFYNTNFKNSLVDGKTTSDLKFRVQPRFVAFLLRPEKWNKTSIEFASFTRDTYYLEQREHYKLETDVISSYPGNETYLADFYYRNDYNDYWFGGGIAHEISSKWKLGISGFYSYSSLKYDYTVSTKAINKDNPDQEIVTYIYDQYINAFSNRLIFKIGTTYSTKGWQFGLAITSPSLHVNGSSESSRDLSTANLHDENGNDVTDMLINDYQEKIPTNFRFPFSLALGVRRLFKKNAVYMSLQYFSNLQEFNTINNPSPTAFLSGDQLNTSAKDWLSITRSSEEVTNFAIGWRGTMKEKLELMGGFRTDFTYHEYDGVKDYDSPTTLVAPSINQYHITGGVQFELLHSDIILGLQYSFSSNRNLEQLANFSDPVEYVGEDQIFLQGYRKNNMQIRENTMSIFLGFTYNINEQNKANKKK